MLPLFYKTKDGKWKLFPHQDFEYQDGRWRVSYTKVIGCSAELREFIYNHADELEYSDTMNSYVLKYYK